jgi:hypothetical protein
MFSKVLLATLAFSQLAYSYPKDATGLHKGLGNADATDELETPIVARDFTGLTNLNDLTHLLEAAEGKGAKKTTCAKTDRDAAATYSIEATKEAMEWGFPHVGRENAVLSGSKERKYYLDFHIIRS